MKQNFHKTIRLKNYNYKSNGYYFVTVVTRLRNNFLKNKQEFVSKILKDTVIGLKGIAIDYSVIMPNHVHIIFVLENSELALGEIVRRFKAKISYNLHENIWQANYYEHVIRTEEALEKIREYVINNPLAETFKFDQFYN